MVGRKKKMIHGGAHWMRAGAAGFPARVCIIHFPSMSHESWPLTCSCACARLSVAACYPPSAPPHVGRDPRWWIRAGTNLLVHLWNKNQGEKEQAEGPHHTRIRLPPDTTWHFTPSMTHTHAHTDTRTYTYSHSTPRVLDFLFQRKHSTTHSTAAKKIREPLKVQHTSGHDVEFFERARHVTDTQQCCTRCRTMT